MSTNIHVYGIKNCDTVRKSIKWLESKDITHEFHDLRKESPNNNLVIQWLNDVGQETLVNKRGLVWRKLTDNEKQLSSQNEVIKLIQENPTVVKRPVLFNGQSWSVGFKPEIWDELF
jgi:arsenate reductase